MAFFPIFLSVVVPVRNQEQEIEKLVSEVSAFVAPIVSDYEIIIVDNSSTDQTGPLLRSMTGINGLPNLQIYALTKDVDNDTASWVGLENALGDFIAVIDPMSDDITFLANMIEKALVGADVVFATNRKKQSQTLLYRVAFSIFQKLYFFFNGLHLANEAPQYRLLSKRVVNFIQRHPQPSVAYRHLPATGGFSRANLNYSSEPRAHTKKNLQESIDRGMRLIVSTTRAPMRLVTSLSLFGAFANVVYSIYVVAVGILKSDVAPGWISLSLQQSGMFFLISLVLLVLGEYILQMASLTNEGPLSHIEQELTSARILRKEKLNIHDTTPTKTGRTE